MVENRVLCTKGIPIFNPNFYFQNNASLHQARVCVFRGSGYRSQQRGREINCKVKPDLFLIRSSIFRDIIESRLAACVNIVPQIISV